MAASRFAITASETSRRLSPSANIRGLAVLLLSVLKHTFATLDKRAILVLCLSKTRRWADYLVRFFFVTLLRATYGAM